MWLWHKLVGPPWIKTNEETLRQYAGNNLAIIDRAGRECLRLEVACNSRTQGRELFNNFGGRVEKLPRDWLKRVSRATASKPLKIGKRLVITNVGGTSSRRLPHRSASYLAIPAGAAFGTGEHVTTAMLLRMLEENTRKMKPGWSAVDIGTGSGILALAAKRFGAGRVLAIDMDSLAISAARANAHLNEIGGIEFRLADVRKWRPQGQFDIIVANLFSELLLDILPRLRTKLRRGGCLILSGVLRSQECELIRALRLNKFVVVQARRRAKWIAMLCGGASASAHPRMRGSAAFGRLPHAPETAATRIPKTH